MKREEERKAKEHQRQCDEEAGSVKADPKPPQMLFFKCSACSHEVLVTRKAFKKDTLDAKTWCNKCKKSCMAKNFKCQCGEYWYKCTLHKEIKAEANESTSKDKPKLAHKKPSKTTLRRKKREEMDLDGLFQEPRRKKPRICEPVFKASMLSPCLKRKFAHLCQKDGG